MKLLILVSVLVPSLTFADIILRSKDQSVAVTYREGDLINYRACRSNTLPEKGWRHCESNTSTYSRPFSHFVKNFLRMFRIPEALNQGNAVSLLATNIEELTRSLEKSSIQEKEKLVPAIENLKIHLKNAIHYAEAIEPHLSEGNDRTLLSGIHEDYLPTIYAFHDLFYDGNFKVWRVGGTDAWHEQERVCGSFWHTTALEDITTDDFPGQNTTPEAREILSTSYLIKQLAIPVAWTTDVHVDKYTSRYSRGVIFGKPLASKWNAIEFFFHHSQDIDTIWQVGSPNGKHWLQYRWFYAPRDFQLPILCWR